MNYMIREHEREIYIIADEGLVYASIIEYTASRARRIVGRDLVEGERFFWLNKLFNKSDKKGEGTQLLQFLIKTLEQRNATIGLIASPEMQIGTTPLHRQVLEKRLKAWYLRHGFQDIGSRYHVLVRPYNTLHDHILHAEDIESLL